jgi:aspartate/methionine/tyrosine aminotransferase
MFSQRTNWNLERNALSEALAEHRAAGKPLIDLTQSNPTACGFHFDSREILAAFDNPANLIYQPDPQGLPHARQAIVDYYLSRNCRVDSADIFLTASTSEAYSFVFRALCNPGDEILIPQPGYPLFNFLADIQDVTLTIYPLLYDHGWQIDMHALQQAITPRTRAVIVVHPNNPTGHFCKPAEIESLNALCANRQMAIISDEVFLDFNLRQQTPPTFASNSQALTFTLSGISKISGLPQIKVAWLIVTGPEALKRQAIARLEMIADTFLSVSTPAQHALPTFLQQRENFHRQWLKRAQNNLAQLDALLATQELCTRLETEGGWYVVLKVPLTAGSDELAMELLTERGVYVHPGHFYDFPANGYLVVSLITPEPEFSAGTSALIEVLRNR